MWEASTENQFHLQRERELSTSNECITETMFGFFFFFFGFLWSFLNCLCFFPPWWGWSLAFRVLWVNSRRRAFRLSGGRSAFSPLGDLGARHVSLFRQQRSFPLSPLLWNLLQSVELRFGPNGSARLVLTSHFGLGYKIFGPSYRIARTYCAL